MKMRSVWTFRSASETHSDVNHPKDEFSILYYVGCGYGYMIQPLLEEGKIVSACDLSPLLIERNKKCFPVSILKP